jgi:uncharacterized membrane protein YecN with MAPEG domain
MMVLPITLTAAALAVLVNLWLGARIARLRQQLKVSVGDGGHEPLLRRMRAQANFIEHAPFFLILLGGLELAGGNRSLLLAAAAAFLLARIAHGIGMDGGELTRFRAAGMMTSTLVTVVLASWGAVVAVAALF